MHLYRNIALGFALLPCVLAIDCTSSNSAPYHVSSGGNSGSGSDSSDPCYRLCGNNEACLDLCGPVTKLKTRAALSCTDSETCFMYIDNSLFCLNVDNGLYHDDEGGNGDLIKGSYTDASGKATTLGVQGTAAPSTSTTAASTQATSTLTSASTSSTSAVVLSVTSTSASSTPAASVPSTVTSATVASPSSTPNSALGRARGSGAAVGIMGLVMVYSLI